eukprot:COSAG06_NODE_58099_length_278_cov_0.575419_1_plen_61_part_10
MDESMDSRTERTRVPVIGRSEDLPCSCIKIYRMNKVPQRPLRRAVTRLLLLVLATGHSEIP